MSGNDAYGPRAHFLLIIFPQKRVGSEIELKLLKNDPKIEMSRFLEICLPTPPQLCQSVPSRGWIIAHTFDHKPALSLSGELAISAFSHPPPFSSFWALRAGVYTDSEGVACVTLFPVLTETSCTMRSSGYGLGASSPLITTPQYQR